MLRVADPDRRYTAVRLASALPLTEAERSFARRDGEWVLDLHPADVQRLEYQLELGGPGGSVECALAPANPHRAPGAFGEKSVLLLPGYREPAWLDAPAVEGRYRELEVPGRGLGASVAIRFWEPAGAVPGRGLAPSGSIRVGEAAGGVPVRPLEGRCVDDGPEQDALASLTRFTAA